MTNLILVRHGHSEGNRDGEFHGNYDGDLTDLGHCQAECTANYLIDCPIDVVYSSDLRRANFTAQHIAKAKSLKVITDIRLREINGGEWERKKFCDLESLYPEDFKLWTTNIGLARCTGGESLEEIKERVYNAVLDITLKNPEKNIVIVTHATPIRVLKCSFMKEPIEYVREYDWVANASVSRIQYDLGKWKIVSYDEHQHLKHFLTSLSGKI